MKKLYMLSVLMCIVIGVICGCGGKQYQRVEISKLISDLRENVPVATQRYVGKYVELSGELNRIDMAGKYFTLKTEDQVKVIYCSVRNNQHMGILSRKSSGGTVTVRGKIRNAESLLGYSLDVDSVE